MRNTNLKNIFSIILLASLIIIMALLNILFQGILFYIVMIILTWLVSIILYKKFFVNKTNRLYLLNIIILYLMLVVSVFIYNKYIDYRLNQFDLNGDSFFSKDEQTAEQIMYMEIWTNSIGRSLIYFWGIFYSLISTFILFIVVKFYTILKKQ